MSASEKPRTLAEAIPAHPGWESDVLTIEVEGAMNWTTGKCEWALLVTKPTKTPSGRKGKPTRVISLVKDTDSSVPDLLRELADIWEVELP
jgi:hypothetical protein